MRLTIEHKTSYRFDQPVTRGLQRVRLRPQSMQLQTVNGWHLDFEGAIHELDFFDEHQNWIDLLSVEPGSTVVTITARGLVDTVDGAGVIDEPLGSFPLWLLSRPTSLTEAGSRVEQLARDFASKPGSPALFHDLSAAIVDRLPYAEGHTSSETTAEHALAGAGAVCQDHAHVFLAVVRQLGFAGRYVSGYLMMDDRVQQAAMHAWADVWIDGLGYVGFDVSNRISPDERYVRIATGMDYRDAAPIAGTRYGSGQELMDVAVSRQEQ